MLSATEPPKHFPSNLLVNSPFPSHPESLYFSHLVPLLFSTLLLSPLLVTYHHQLFFPHHSLLDQGFLHVI